MTKYYNNKTEQYFQNKRLEMTNFIPSNAEVILEIGCGTGAFGFEIKKKKDIIIWGVEPNLKASLIAKKQLDYVINSTFDENTDFNNLKFDCIVFNDVLEHIAYPLETIEIAKKHLKPNGVIVSSIPNVYYYWNFLQNILYEDWKYEDAGIMDKTHLRFFSSKSIVRMFEESGAEIIKHQGINSFYSRKFKLFNYLTLFRFNNWQFQQFATVAKYA